MKEEKKMRKKWKGRKEMGFIKVRTGGRRNGGKEEGRTGEEKRKEGSRRPERMGKSQIEKIRGERRK